MKSPFQLLLLVKRHRKKRKVVPETGCWDTLLKTERRYNSWWPKIKLVCKMTWKRTGKWPFIFLLLMQSGSAKWYCFSSNYYVGVEHWPNVQEKSARCKINYPLLWHIANVMSHYAWTKKEFVFEFSMGLLRYKNFLNDFFICSNKVIYMTNFVGQTIVSLRIYTVAFKCLIAAELIFLSTNLIKLYLDHGAQLF